MHICIFSSFMSDSGSTPMASVLLHQAFMICLHEFSRPCKSIPPLLKFLTFDLGFGTSHPRLHFDIRQRRSTSFRLYRIDLWQIQFWRILWLPLCSIFFFFFVPRSNATNVSAFPTLLSGFFFRCERKVLSCKHLNHPSYSNSLAKGLEIFTQLQGLSKLKEIKNFISKGNSKPARNCSRFFDVSCQESSMICCLLQTKRLVSARE